MVNQILETKFTKLSDSPKEYERLTDLLNGLDIPYSLTEDYSYPDIPLIPFLMQEAESGELRSSKYSLWNANPAAFMARATVHNVLSCHTLRRYKEQWAGNLGYICSPYWGNFWLIKTNSENKAELEAEIYCDHSDWPNPISSINYLLLDHPEFGKLICLSPARYGAKFDHDFRLQNIALSIHKATGLPVGLLESGSRIQIHYRPQVTIGSGYVGQRWSDISDPDTFKDQNNQPVVKESFSVELLCGEYPGLYRDESLTFGLTFEHNELKDVNLLRNAQDYTNGGEDNDIYCADCGDVCGNSDSGDLYGECINDEYYCESCAREKYNICHKCNTTIGIPDERNYPGHIEINDNTYCDDCGKEFLELFFDYGEAQYLNDGPINPSDGNEDTMLEECLNNNDNSVILYHFIDIDKDGKVIEYIDEWFYGIHDDADYTKRTYFKDLEFTVVDLTPNYINTERTAQLSFAFSLPEELTWEEAIRRMAHT